MEFGKAQYSLDCRCLKEVPCRLLLKAAKVVENWGRRTFMQSQVVYQFEISGSVSVRNLLNLHTANTINYYSIKSNYDSASRNSLNAINFFSAFFY
jgi:hypothetical protein